MRRMILQSGFCGPDGDDLCRHGRFRHRDARRQAGRLLRTANRLRNAKAEAKKQELPYAVVTAVQAMDALNTPFDKLSNSYDVVVAGGGTGGFGAALQAARMGAKVLLLEETDCIGGQMANAGVTSMDEGGFWGKNTVRERASTASFTRAR